MKYVNQPKTEKGQETLDKIILEAERLFSEKGYYKTSIKDITKAAEVGIGTFYIYFEDKHSLYQAILSEYGHFIRKTIAESVRTAETRLEAERMGIETFIRLVRKRPSMYNVIWQALYVDKKLFVDYYTKFSENYIKQILIAQEKGEIIADYDPEALSYMLMGITNFIGLRYAIFDDQTDLDPILDEVMDMLVNGIYTHNERME
ncbi:transcriptional regulator, TetR family [Alkalibacterium putridalgicola]|uniref:AcrR family transcriptional regulator n=1 Tax=Alkalibacterium putridalgicola TaxID=426703 RepID=A0A1H7VXZ4_9LACT|nr:TetR/AcrR family transcriptional regulator [Alkalibacterium putridalgicola]GEK89370.1 AcrR family transcriptional regulator [Alkalibacterium putridalgicola]SEM13934.1 transcriptional regulator, TetR family [Alkalibacterium putridalgicola]